MRVGLHFRWVMISCIHYAYHIGVLIVAVVTRMSVMPPINRLWLSNSR